jgi:hypothetical protein
VACMRDKRSVHRDLLGTPEEKSPFGRPRRKWEKSTKTDQQEVEWRQRLDRACLGEGQVNVVMNLWVP